jgi:nucleotide-binding universal stress UspA family protein
MRKIAKPKSPARASRTPAISLQRITSPPTGPVIDLIPRVRRILVPVDFSEPSAKALQYAASFARQFDAKISVIHACPVPYYPAEFGGFPTVMPVDEPPTKAIQHRLEEDFRRAIPAEMRGRTLLRSGAAFDEICKAAKSLKADLIIIATHGHTGLKHALLGSTAERVVRHAPCPVLVVRTAERDFA